LIVILVPVGPEIGENDVIVVAFGLPIENITPLGFTIIQTGVCITIQIQYIIPAACPVNGALSPKSLENDASYQYNRTVLFLLK